MNGTVQDDIIEQLISRRLSSNLAKAYEEFGVEYRAIASDSPLEGIRAKKLRLYAVDQSTTIKDITEILKNIKDCLPALRNICARPRSHLKSINEVRPIDTVKRVGYESISYLASHSEDWLARTASGLKPARLFSRVEEDDFAIYENKVVKTLIDKISRFLKDSINDLEYKNYQLKGILNSKDTNLQGFGFDRGFQKAISELIPDTFMGDEKIKELQLAEKMLGEAKLLKKSFSDLKQSRLYKLIHREKSVTNPLNETNILLFDKDYKKIFILWENMQKAIIPEQESKIPPDDIKMAKEAYSNFCKVLVYYALHSLNFIQNENPRNIFSRDNISITVFYATDKLTILFRDITKRKLDINSDLQIPLADGEKFEKFSRIGNELFWENDIMEEEIETFCNRLVQDNKNSKNRDKERRSKHQLKSLILDKKRKAGNPKIKNLIIVPLFCQIEDEERLKMSSCFEAKSSGNCNLTIFALPLIQENERLLTQYASKTDARFAVLPLTLFDINSYRRLQKIFLKTILEFEDEKCPYCGGAIRQTENGRRCNDCDLIVTTTTCPQEDCKYTYKYTWYSVSDDELQAMRQIKDDDFFNRDSLFQYKDTVSMQIKDAGLAPVCPKCMK